MGLDQYGMIGCTTEKREDAVTGKEYIVKMAEQDFYWRKHSRLQNFMEQLWVEKTGRPDVELNCNDLELTMADIDRLEEAWDIEFAKNKSEGGFFYGHQMQVGKVQNYRDKDLDFIEAAKSALQEGKQVVYSCWW